MVFGQNSGQQCVAMSLYSLIYNNKQGVNSANDLVSIMNIGNQLYSSLSQLTLWWNMRKIPQYYQLSYKRRRSNEETKSPPTWTFPLATIIIYIYVNFCFTWVRFCNCKMLFKILTRTDHPRNWRELVQNSSVRAIWHCFRSIHRKRTQYWYQILKHLHHFIIVLL